MIVTFKATDLQTLPVPLETVAKLPGSLEDINQVDSTSYYCSWRLVTLVVEFHCPESTELKPVNSRPRVHLRVFAVQTMSSFFRKRQVTPSPTEQSYGTNGRSVPEKPVILYLIRLSPPCRIVWLYLAQVGKPMKN